MAARTEKLGLFDDVVDEAAVERTVERFRERSIKLPTFAELADPSSVDPTTRAALAGGRAFITMTVIRTKPTTSGTTSRSRTAAMSIAAAPHR